MEIVPYKEWSGAVKSGLLITASHEFNPAVIHWFGPGYAPDSDDDTAAMLRSFRRFHMQKLGWLDIGYNYAIGRSGTVYELRGHNKRGAHAGNNHANGFSGVLLMAGTDRPDITEKQIDSLQRLAELRNYNRFTGHREWSSTTCPGPVIWPWITENRMPSIVKGQLGQFEVEYGFESLPFNLGGFGPGPCNDKMEFKYQWRYKAWRDARFDTLVAKHPGYVGGKFRLDNGNYAIVFWPAGFFGSRPRWMHYHSAKTRDQAMKKVAGPLRKFRVTRSFNGSYMSRLP